MNWGGVKILGVHARCTRGTWIRGLLLEKWNGEGPPVAESSLRLQAEAHGRVGVSALFSAQCKTPGGGRAHQQDSAALAASVAATALAKSVDHGKVNGIVKKSPNSVTVPLVLVRRARGTA